MARTLSNTMLEAMTAGQSGTPTLVLLTITHPDLETPLRIVNNTENVTSGGNTFTGMGFEIALPDNSEGAAPRARLRIDNTSQWLTPTIRGLSGQFQVTIEIAIPSNIAASPPEYNNVEVSFLPMDLVDVQWDAATVEGSLTYENIANNKFPAGSFTPYDFPGMF